MNQRKWIVLVIGLSVGVPVVIELLTLAGMIHVGFFGGDPSQSGNVSDRQEDRLEVHDTLSLAPRLTLRIQKMNIRAQRNDWTLRLDAVIRNDTRNRITFRSRHVHLDSARNVQAPRDVLIKPGMTGTLKLRLKLPPGTEPVNWSIEWFDSEGEREQSGDRVLPLGKIPVHSGS